MNPSNGSYPEGVREPAFLCLLPTWKRGQLEPAYWQRFGSLARAGRIIAHFAAVAGAGRPQTGCAEDPTRGKERSFCRGNMCGRPDPCRRLDESSASTNYVISTVSSFYFEVVHF